MISAATTTYNNLCADKSWKFPGQGSKSKDEADPDTKFLALTSQIEDLKNSFANGNKGGEKVTQSQRPGASLTPNTRLKCKEMAEHTSGVSMTATLGLCSVQDHLHEPSRL